MSAHGPGPATQAAKLAGSCRPMTVTRTYQSRRSKAVTERPPSLATDQKSLVYTSICAMRGTSWKPSAFGYKEIWKYAQSRSTNRNSHRCRRCGGEIVRRIADFILGHQQ